MKSSLLKFAIVIFSSFAAFLGFRTLADYRFSYHEDREKALVSSLKNAEGLIKRSQPYKALLQLEEISIDTHLFPQYQKKWTQLALISAVNLKDSTLIKALYQEYPSVFLENEEASLLLAAQWIVEDQPQLVEPLFKHWNQETSPYREEWILLLADAKTILKEHEQASALLQAELLKKENNFNRLLRLSIHHLHEHPKFSWNFLNQAAALNYENHALDYYRMRLLSGNGYVDLSNKILKKLAKETNDSFYTEELINHYLQENLLAEAYSLIEKALVESPTVPLIQQGILIHKIYRPLKYEWGRLSMNDHPEAHFLRYLLAIPSENLWDEKLLMSQKSVAKHAHEDIESQWLATLQALKMNDGVKAMMLLKEHPDMSRISPYLYVGLQHAILTKNPHLPYTASTLPKANKQIPSKIKDIVENPSSRESQEIFTHQDAYALLLLAAGWNEAFLKFNVDRSSSEWPSWAIFKTTQALKNNRNLETAIAYAKTQPQKGKLPLLLGQLYLEKGDIAKGFAILEPFLKSSSQAASVWSTYLIQANRYALAKKTILENQNYRDTLQGQERLAFLEHKLGNIEEADQIYRKIINQSSQAKSYWAAKSYQSGNYALAKKLLSKLVEEFPTDEALKNQLAEVISK